MSPSNRPRRRQQGFTLAEMLVASTLLTIVLGGAYTAFSTTSRAWRVGEKNYATFQDARGTLALLERELQSTIGAASYLFEGTNDTLTFLTLSAPLDPEEGEGNHVMWVRYRLKKDRDKEGAVIVREEARVLSALPEAPSGEDGFQDHDPIKKSREDAYELAQGVVGWELDYVWIPRIRQPHDQPPVPIDPIVLTESRAGWGLPQAVRITLVLKNENADTGNSTFYLTVPFYGRTSAYDERRMGLAG